MQKLFLSIVFSMLGLVSAFSQQCIDFEQFTEGDVFGGPAYAPGDVVAEVDGLPLVLSSYKNEDGVERFFSLKIENAQTAGFAFGQDNVLSLRGGGLLLDFASTVGVAESIYLYYKQDQGLVRTLEVNGVVHTNTDFSQFPQEAAPGVSFRHQFQERLTQGIIILEGNIEQLVISGEALELDNMCYSKSGPTSVFAGDANNDGRCDYRDFLYVGAGFGSAGPFRVNGSNDWIAQHSLDWKSQGAVNLKYADANGDGFVDEADFETIGLENIGKSHSQGERVTVEDGDVEDDFSMYFEKEDPASEGGPDTVIYEDGEPMQPLALYLNPGQVNDEIYGYSWVWRFNPQYFQSPTFVFETNNEMGQDGNMFTFLDTSRVASGILGCTVVRTDGNPVQVTERMDVGSFNGIIVDLVGIVVSDDGVIDVDSIEGIDELGNSIAIVDLDSTVVFAPKENVGNEENPWTESISVYPIPVSDILRLEVAREAKAYLKEVIVYNESGQKVLSKQLAENDYFIDLREVPVGNYFLEMIFDSYPSIGKAIQISR